jgi:hypothetical protein
MPRAKSNKRRRTDDNAEQEMRDSPLGECLMKLFSFGLIMEAQHDMCCLLFGVCQHVPVFQLFGLDPPEFMYSFPTKFVSLGGPWPYTLP